eukprot:Polyplicarium_translucidae@DN716_c0_g1_i3.p2
MTEGGDWPDVNFRSNLVCTGFKAGLPDGDAERKASIDRRIFELSKGSKFYRNEERKSAQVEAMAEQIRRRMAAFRRSTLEARREVELQAQRSIEHFRERRRRAFAGRVVVHVDLDMFYCAVGGSPALHDRAAYCMMPHRATV